MRRSGGSPLFVFDEKTKQCIGVQLPPDFAAEHESGIGGISEDFGLPSREELVAKQMWFLRKSIIRLSFLMKVSLLK